MVKNPFHWVKNKIRRKDKKTDTEIDDINTNIREQPEIKDFFSEDFSLENEEGMVDYHETLVSKDSEISKPKERGSAIHKGREYTRRTWESVSEIEKKIDNMDKKDKVKSTKSKINGKVEKVISDSKDNRKK